MGLHLLWAALSAQAATLSEAWAEAERHAPELAASRASAEASAATIPLARARLMPQISVQGGYTLTDEDVEIDIGASLPPAATQMLGEIPPIAVQPAGWWQGSASLALPLIDLDAIASLRAASASREASQLAVDAIWTDLREAVAEAFYGAYVARQGVQISERAVAVATRQQSVAERLVEAGAAVPRTALEAKQALFAAERDLHRAIATEVAAREALHRLTGMPRGTPIDLGLAEAQEYPARIEDRPDVKLAIAQRQAAQRQTSAAALVWMPDLGAQLTGVRTGNPGLADDGWIAQGTIQASFRFDGGATAARTRFSRAQAAAASAQLDVVRAVAEQEIAVLLAEQTRAASALAAAEQEHAAAQSALSDAEQAFAQGAATFLEVERASLGLSAASLSIVRERVALELAAVKLSLAAGR